MAHVSWWRRRHLETDPESGLSLIETLVSLIVFALMITAIAATINTSIGIARNNRSRVVAANLAGRELDAVRNRFFNPSTGPASVTTGLVSNPDPLPAGAAGAALTVNNTPFSVVREAEWVQQGATSGPCDGGSSGQLAYLSVRVTVTWPNMTNKLPVIATTILTPPLGTYSSSSGHIKVKVLDRNGRPAAGDNVTITGPSGSQLQTTATDGCAFFAYLLPGAYTAQLGSAGYVTSDNTAQPSQRTPSTTVNVVAGQVGAASFDYDQEAKLSLTMASTQQYPLAPGVPLTYTNAGLRPSGVATNRALFGTTRLVDGLWPYPGGYGAYFGDCQDSNPGGASTGGAYWPGYVGATSGPAQQPFASNPGATTPGTLTTKGTDVYVVNSSSQPVPGVSVVAVHAADTGTGCVGPVPDPTGGAAGAVVSVGTTDATGHLAVSMPFGSWTFKVLNKTPNGTPQPSLLDPRQQTPAAVTVAVTP